jgi:hypothetical protein
LAWEPTLWKSVNFDGGENLDADFAIESVLKLLARDTGGSVVCSVVERFSLNNCFRVTDIGLSVIARRCPELRRINLRNCKEVTNVGVQAIATKCTSLSNLDLSGKVNKYIYCHFRQIWINLPKANVFFTLLGLMQSLPLPCLIIY